MSATLEETAECRGCRQTLRGRPYWYGESAYHPITGKRAKINHYGGFVCSESCDRRASLELESDMPGHSYGQTRLSCYAADSLSRNWA